ncbi:hypothetical protein AB0G00_15770 [Nocardia salmonicida]|uniref:hypothetical protein n=1 Tax=Nocardia TaxID=1817 RepID=UPI002658EB76|nr:hypothetical protein [Nocardia sp. PE-7]WKG12068.1 hypothetical protein QX204_11625 [Nocardia sp. PE-7]
MPAVRRFWIEFDRGHTSALWWSAPYAGVTGYDEQDCLAMVADLLTDGAKLPPVRRITPDIVVDENLPVNIRALGVPSGSHSSVLTSVSTSERQCRSALGRESSPSAESRTVISPGRLTGSAVPKRPGERVACVDMPLAPPLPVISPALSPVRERSR